MGGSISYSSSLIQKRRPRGQSFPRGLPHHPLGECPCGSHLDCDLVDRRTPIALAGAASQSAELHHVSRPGGQSFEKDVPGVLERDHRTEIAAAPGLDPALDRFDRLPPVRGQLFQPVPDRRPSENASFNNLVIYLLDRCVQNKL